MSIAKNLATTYKMRSTLPKLWQQLQHLDNNVIDKNGMANHKCRGDYSVKVTTDSI